MINELTTKQQIALDMMMSGQNVFLTGDAGTGKTTLIKAYIDQAENAGKNVLVCATTGIAADAIGHGACTMHRLFHISIGPADCRRKPRRRNDLLKAADTLIIDEIGMCRSDLFSLVAKMIENENDSRVVDEMLTGEKKNNLQVILSGDFAQLPPVLSENDRDILVQLYGDIYAKGGSNEHGYCYRTEEWMRMELHGVYLDEICRQQDRDYMYILSDIRNGINMRKAVDYLCNNSANHMITGAPYLVPRNATADNINRDFLRRLNPATEVTLMAEVTGHITDTDVKNICFAPQKLIINIGAQVMVTVNSQDEDNNYVNGTIGTIVDIVIGNRCTDSDYVEVLTNKGDRVKVYRYDRDVERQVIKKEIIKKSGKKEERTKIATEIIGTYSQIPIKLAWAISIHKSQGQTFDMINIDPQCWDVGQFYTAISRAKAIDGIYFMREIKKSYIKAFSYKEKENMKKSLKDFK